MILQFPTKTQLLLCKCTAIARNEEDFNFFIDISPKALQHLINDLMVFYNQTGYTSLQIDDSVAITNLLKRRSLVIEKVHHVQRPTADLIIERDSCEFFQTLTQIIG